MNEPKKIMDGLKKRVNRLVRETLKDVKVEVAEEFDRNFEREAFFNEKWARRKYNDDKSRGLLVRTGNLRRSIHAEITGRDSVVFSSALEYARIHNEGGTITVTRKMKNYFWWRYHTVTGGRAADGFSNRLQRRKDGSPRNNRHNRTLTAEAEFYRAMALKKVGSKITIPKRRFIGTHPQLEELLKGIFLENAKRIFEE